MNTSKENIKLYKKEWSSINVLQLLSKIESKMLDWNSKYLNLSLSQRGKIK